MPPKGKKRAAPPSAAAPDWEVVPNAQADAAVLKAVKEVQAFWTHGNIAPSQIQGARVRVRGSGRRTKTNTDYEVDIAVEAVVYKAAIKGEGNPKIRDPVDGRIWVTEARGGTAQQDSAVANKNGVPPSFIETSFTTKVEYEAWLKTEGYVQAGAATKRTVTINTSNEGKFKEFQRMFDKVSGGTIVLDRRTVDLPEIVGTPEEVVANKAAAAGDGVLIEDTSLDIEGHEVGVDVRWLLEKLDTMIGAKCVWRVLMGLMEGDKVKIYRGEVRGTIVRARGEGGFGFDPVVQPDGADKTLAESKPDEVSARYVALCNVVANKVDVETPPIKEWNGKWQH